MNQAIIRSRNCPPIDIEHLKYIPDTIVSGGARGVDTYAREFAMRMNHEVKLRELLKPISNEDEFSQDS